MDLLKSEREVSIQLWNENLNKIVDEINSMNDIDKISVLNQIKETLHMISPFKTEPVDCVLWVPANEVSGNDYNPNKVAPPEMKLLELSIREDGYTQPIVTFGKNGYYEVVDGFHRNRIGKESKEISGRIHGFLPITCINTEREDKGDRIAATIRHNRARGKHTVDGMSVIVQELSRRNWNDEKIARELGMEPDEILRLKQITGLAEMFADEEFSEAWEAID